MQAYQTKIDAANASIDELTVSAAEKKLFHQILIASHTFIGENLSTNTLSAQRTALYAKSLKPYFMQLSSIVIAEQVNHWMQIVADWKQLLGKDWPKTYGVAMYIPVSPKNDMMLNILAYYMGTDAIGKSLFAFTSEDYNPTPEQAMTLLAQATPDQALAEQVYGEYYLQYAQIIGQFARADIQAHS